MYTPVTHVTDRRDDFAVVYHFEGTRRRHLPPQKLEAQRKMDSAPLPRQIHHLHYEITRAPSTETTKSIRCRSQQPARKFKLCRTSRHSFPGQNVELLRGESSDCKRIALETVDTTEALTDENHTDVTPR